MESVYKTCIFIFIPPGWWSDILAGKAISGSSVSPKRLFISEVCRVFFSLYSDWAFFSISFLHFDARSTQEPIISFISYFVCRPSPLTCLDAEGRAFFQNLIFLWKKRKKKQKAKKKSILNLQLISIWSFTRSSFRSGLLYHWPPVALPTILTSRIGI